MKFIQHNDHCWHAFDDTAEATLIQEGVVAAHGLVVRLDIDGVIAHNRNDCQDFCKGMVEVIDGQIVWNANAIGNAWGGDSEDLTAENLREIAYFMDSRRFGYVAQPVKGGECGIVAQCR
jgi:hypothetical protein